MVVLFLGYFYRQNKTKVGLKADTRMCSASTKDSQNKTKVGLKGIFHDEMEEILKSQNKTKVGLKGSLKDGEEEGNTVRIRLK